MNLPDPDEDILSCHELNEHMTRLLGAAVCRKCGSTAPGTQFVDAYGMVLCPICRFGPSGKPPKRKRK